MQQGGKSDEEEGVTSRKERGVQSEQAKHPLISKRDLLYTYDGEKKKEKKMEKVT